jgi:serine/threonine protein kinase
MKAIVSSATMALAPGEIVDGRYRVIRAIAEGGMGVVYEAEHTGLHKRVALKLLKAEVAAAPGAVARFEREARATSALEHPRIVRVTDFGHASQGHYFAMELLDGHTLGAVLAATPRLPVVRSLTIADRLLDGLCAAHAAGLVHRDLKPDNVFLCADDDVRLLDFGIAAMRLPGSTKLTHAGAVLGTPAYMSPEQAMGKPDVDARTDVHAVGAMVYEMLAGRPPYVGDSYNEVIHKILVGDPPPLRERCPEAPAHVVATVMRALAADPAERLATATALREALSGAGTPEWRLPAQLATTDLGAPEASPTPPSPTPSPSRLTAPRLIEAEPVIALELDRPPAPPEPTPPPATRPRWLLPLLGALLIAGLGAAWTLRPAEKHDAIIEIVAPADVKLILDGTPIVGRRLQLPIGNEVHELVLHKRGQTPKRVHFRPVGDRRIDFTEAQ